MQKEASAKHKTIRELENTARLLRRDVLEMIFHAGDGHPAPSLSAANIVAAPCFGTMRVRPTDPGWPERDRFILSKGHACPVLYAALARLGFFPKAELAGLRSLSSMLQGYPDMDKTP